MMIQMTILSEGPYSHRKDNRKDHTPIGRTILVSAGRYRREELQHGIGGKNCKMPLSISRRQEESTLFAHRIQESGVWKGNLNNSRFPNTSVGPAVGPAVKCCTYVSMYGYYVRISTTLFSKKVGVVKHQYYLGGSC
jgi:hypothetical protein